jgi:acetyltransferase-like isoleucine patch superfamily enzyme
MSDLALAAEKIGHEVLGILDHQYHGNTATVDGIDIIGDERWLSMPVSDEVKHWTRHCDFFVATLNDGEQQPINSGLNREQLRYQRIRLLEQQDLSVATLIDPDSGVTRNRGRRHWRAEIGRGVYIAPTADLANSVVIGDWSVIERHTFIGHHCRVGRNTAILPTSHVTSITVGDNACIGYGAQTRRDPRHPHYTVGNWSTVWSHAWIDRDVPDNSILTHHGRMMTKQRGLEWCDPTVDQ